MKGKNKMDAHERFRFRNLWSGIESTFNSNAGHAVRNVLNVVDERATGGLLQTLWDAGRKAFGGDD